MRGPGGERGPRVEQRAGLGEPVGHRLGGGAGQGRDRGYGASQVAGVERSARAGQHAGGGVADDDVVTLADGDEVLGAQPDTIEQRQPVGGGPGRCQSRGRGGGEGEDQLCLGGGLGGGEAGERGRRALEGAERLAGVRARSWRPGSGRRGRRLSPGRSAEPPRHRAGGRGRLARFDRGLSGRRSATGGARGRQVCLCSSAVIRAVSGPRSGGVDASGGRCSRAFRRASIELKVGRGPRCRRGAALQAGQPGLQFVELSGERVDAGGSRAAGQRMLPDPEQADGQDDEADAGQPGQQMMRRRRGGNRWLRDRFGRRLGERFRQWFGGGFTHRSSASIAS